MRTVVKHQRSGGLVCRLKEGGTLGSTDLGIERFFTHCSHDAAGVTCDRESVATTSVQRLQVDVGQAKQT